MVFVLSMLFWATLFCEALNQCDRFVIVRHFPHRILTSMLPWILLILQALCVHGQPGGLLDPSQLIEGAWSLHPTVSVGSVRRGRVLFGKKLESDEWIYVKDPNGSWVVDPAPKVLRELSQSIKAQYPDFDRLVINDGSVRHGGLYRPHRTHQSGRDIDIRYLLKGSVKGDYTFRFVTPANFDTERNWAIMKWLYDSGRVSRILMDHGHQKRLWKYAQAAEIVSGRDRPILSYPYRQRGALVRHARGHTIIFMSASLHSPETRSCGRFKRQNDSKTLPTSWLEVSTSFVKAKPTAYCQPLWFNGGTNQKVECQRRTGTPEYWGDLIT